jgi:hypothetical protein
MPDVVWWVGVATAFATLVAAITTQVIRVLDKRHDHHKELETTKQDANDRMFHILRADIDDLRKRYVRSNEDHAECLRRYERMAGRVEYLEDALTTANIPYKKWVEHGSDHHESMGGI